MSPGKVRGAHNQKLAVHRPGGELSPEMELTGTLLMDFSSPEWWEKNCLLVKPMVFAIAD